MGAESDSVVNVPNWTVVAGGFTAVKYKWSGGPDLAQYPPLPPDPGLNYFYGGPSPRSTVSSATQSVSLANGASAIAGGTVKATLSAYLGGVTNFEDNARVTVSFLGAQNNVLKTLTIGPVPKLTMDGNNLLHFRTATTIVPKASDSVQIKLRFTKEDEGEQPHKNINGVADNLSLVLAQS